MLRDPLMDLLAPNLEETLISGLLHRSVLEGVGRLMLEAAAEHQAGGGELV